MKKQGNIRKQVSKTKILLTGKLSRKIIIPVINTTHPEFKIGGCYFEPELYPNDETIKQLNLNDADINDYVLIVAFFKKSDREYEQSHLRATEYFNKKRAGEFDFLVSTWLPTAKNEIKEQLISLTDIKHKVMN